MQLRWDRSAMQLRRCWDARRCSCDGLWMSAFLGGPRKRGVLPQHNPEATPATLTCAVKGVGVVLLWCPLRNDPFLLSMGLKEQYTPCFAGVCTL